MSPKSFIKRLEELYAINVEISRKKNHDYSGTGDALANPMAVEMYGIRAEHGLLVRMNDKMMRIGNGLKGELKVEDESILDTLSDLANYAMILRIVIEHKRNQGI